MSTWMQWRPYVPVARRRANAIREMEHLRKKGKDIQPIRIDGRTIARSFWGKGWCDHLESFSDFENRLPRGRSYVRNGSVCHLAIQPGRIEAMVSGSELYNVNIRIKKLKPKIWRSVKKRCAGRIGSMLELLQGRLSEGVMRVVSDRKLGLFPQPDEIELGCDCPDWAVMCKHVAAVLYGVGSRLDDRPELLFLLRDVDAEELISTDIAVPAAGTAGDQLDEDQLGQIFDIEVDDAGEAQPGVKTGQNGRRTAKAGQAGRRTVRKAADTTQAQPKRRPVTRRIDQRQSRASMPAANVSGDDEKSVRRNGVRRKRAAAAPIDNGQRSNTGNGAPRSGNEASRFRPTGKSVAHLRREIGISAGGFANMLGVSEASVRRWEATKGRLNLQARPLAALADLHESVLG